jgi:FMN reductase
MVAEVVTGQAPVTVLEVADLGAELLSSPSPAVESAVAQLAAADLAVIASPTYKGTYTGLLKLFLDRVVPGQLAGLVAVPVMVAAQDRHALAGEVHLKPVLAELGISCPTAAVFLREDHVDDRSALDDWLAASRLHLEDRRAR